jgi:hypothetical protein
LTLPLSSQRFATVCVTKAQPAALLSQSAAAGVANPSPASPTPSLANPSPRSPTPIIQINGDNPARINVGDTYQDLGATITGPQADLNLGLKTLLNGQLVSTIVIDTSAAATDTIDYVATKQSGLTATSTRTVIIQAPPTAPAGDASTTATTTPQ